MINFPIMTVGLCLLALTGLLGGLGIKEKNPRATIGYAITVFLMGFSSCILIDYSGVGHY